MKFNPNSYKTDQYDAFKSDPKCDINIFINERIYEQKSRQHKLAKENKIKQNNIIIVNDYNSLILNINKFTDRLVIAYFDSEQLFTCKQFSCNVLPKLSDKFKNETILLRVNYDSNKKFKSQYNIQYFP